MRLGVVSEDGAASGGDLTAGGIEDRGLAEMAPATEKEAARIGERVYYGSDVRVAAGQRANNVTVPKLVLQCCLRYAFCIRLMR